MLKLGNRGIELLSVSHISSGINDGLLRRTHRVRPGETILFHAAAGGVGLIACQWAHHLGATVIGTVGSDEKAELARAMGVSRAAVTMGLAKLETTSRG